MNLDRFSQPGPCEHYAPTEVHVCIECGENEAAEDSMYCPQCAWEREIQEMSDDWFADMLDEMFLKKTFEWDVSGLTIFFTGDRRDVAKVRQMLEVRGVRYTLYQDGKTIAIKIATKRGALGE